MKVFVDNKKIELDDRSLIAEGGQGRVYGQGGIAYKIYLDVNDMIPAGKIKELFVLSDPRIIKPEKIIFDSSSKPIGYTMPLLSQDKTHFLCNLFVRDFRNTNKISFDQVLKLIKKFQDLVHYVHGYDILIRDFNEVNFLINSVFDDLYFLDVDSYGTKNYPCNFIKDEVRDRHSNGYSKLTDWFSFAIVSFEMMIGIHPFGGKHSSIKSLDQRMKQNISVFNSEVSSRNAPYPFSLIPENYKNWYLAVFEKGIRLPPPNDFVTSIQQTIQNIKTTVSQVLEIFEIAKIGEANSEIINYLCHNGIESFITSDGLWFKNKQYKNINPDNKVLYHHNDLFVCEKNLDKIKVTDLNGNQIPLNLSVSEIMTYDNRLYVKNDSYVIQVELKDLCGRILPDTKIVCQALSKSSKLFEGCLIQNLFNSCFISIFGIEGQSLQFKINELEGHQILNAKFNKNIVVLTSVKDKKYHKFILKLKIQDSQVKEYKIREIDFDLDINFAILDTGICAHFLSDGDLELSSTYFDNNSIKIIKDNLLNSNMKLFSYGAKLAFAQNNCLSTISMKK